MKSLRRPRRSVSLVALAAVLAGCTSSGLSPRETDRQNYSSLVYSLYELPATPADAADAPLAAPPKLARPARVAVAQVGEVAPPQALLAKLRGRPDLFSRVESISGTTAPIGPGGEFPQQAAYSSPAPGSQEQVRLDVSRMRRMARDMGMDCLLVIGGTMDYATHGNGLAILDLTIVGAFVVPSKEITAKATAAGALVDVESGRVVLTASADAGKGGLASTATQEGGELNVLRQARDEVVDKLADSVVAQCQRLQVAGVN